MEHVNGLARQIRSNATFFPASSDYMYTKIKTEGSLVPRQPVPESRHGSTSVRRKCRSKSLTIRRVGD
jgi:hypothetical protein